MSLEIVSRSCPFCFLQDKKLNLEINSKATYSDFTEKELKIIWNDFPNKKFFFPYYRCECGGLYNKEYFSIKSLNELYSKMTENVFIEKNLDIKTKISYISILSQNGSFNNVLEIGPDNGSFAENLIKQKIVKNIDFVEPNMVMHSKLKKISKNPIFQNIYEINNNSKYDLVIGIHVFDHISDIKNCITKLNSLLNNKGVIFGVVHNEKSLLAKIFANKWPAYHILHPHLFNTDSISLPFKNFGFEQIFIKKTLNYLNVSYLLEHLITAIFNKKVNIFPLLELPVKIGNFAFCLKKIKHILMEENTLENLKIIEDTDKELLHIQMEQLIMVSGKRVN